MIESKDISNLREIERFLSMLIDKGIIIKAFIEFDESVEAKEIYSVHTLNVWFPKHDHPIEIAKETDFDAFRNRIIGWGIGFEGVHWTG
jgi:hypothetical protein